ncbi:hypothetical protein APHAL10511_000035 [Amanita phalloides]|nr:hypothetical protein APHAL10511_000035 [Amanita phalloides]
MPSLASSELRQNVMAAVFRYDVDDGNYDNVLAEILRAIQQGFDVAMAFLQYIVQFITVRLPQMIKNIDYQQVGQVMLVVLQYVLLFAIDNERGIAISLLVLSIILCFPLIILLFIFLLVLQLVFLAILFCIGIGLTYVRTSSLVANYQSQIYGGFTPVNSWLTRRQSRTAIRFLVPVMPPLVLLLGLMCMTASIALFVDSSHQGQALKAMLEAISKPPPLH